jgi:hypothetical protein
MIVYRVVCANLVFLIDCNIATSDASTINQGVVFLFPLHIDPFDLTDRVRLATSPISAM